MALFIPGGGGTSPKGLYEEAPSERGTAFLAFRYKNG